jgi:hypothetical protein
VDAAAEGDVLANVRAVQPEFVWILELERIPVGRAEAQHHHGPRRNINAAKRRRLARQPEVHLRRALRAQ